jgi:hypothetical protein
MILTIEVSEKEANRIAYVLNDKAGDVEALSIPAWLRNPKAKPGDVVHKSLLTDAAMLKRVAKSITKQVKR